MTKNKLNKSKKVALERKSRPTWPSPSGIAGLRETHSRAFGSTQQAKELYPYLKSAVQPRWGGPPRIVYASRIPPRPTGGRRLAISLFCGRQILQNRGQELSKITPRGSRGHQKPLSGAPRAASWVTRAQLGTHFDARRDYLGVVGPQVGAPGAHFVAPMDCFGCPRPPF